MRIPVVKGLIARRILVNYRVDPSALASLLPQPFLPKLVNGHGMAGICLIRLASVRPRFVPAVFGHASENAAHRIAVTWNENGIERVGVFVHRRDTNSRLNTWVGGRLFPGVHHLAEFTVSESNDQYCVELQSDDHRVRLKVRGAVAPTLPAGSVFKTLAEASRFFERGSLGYSPGRSSGQFEGLELNCPEWHMQPLAVAEVESSFFADPDHFQPGAVEFDCALLMRNIAHEWHGRGTLRNEP